MFHYIFYQKTYQSTILSNIKINSVLKSNLIHTGSADFGHGWFVVIFDNRRNNLIWLPIENQADHASDNK